MRINRYRDSAYTRLGSTEPPFTLAADTWYRVLLQRSGDTLRAKLWPDGEDEPADWQSR